MEEGSLLIGVWRGVILNFTFKKILPTEIIREVEETSREVETTGNDGEDERKEKKK